MHISTGFSWTWRKPIEKTKMNHAHNAFAKQWKNNFIETVLIHNLSSEATNEFRLGINHWTKTIVQPWDYSTFHATNLTCPLVKNLFFFLSLPKSTNSLNFCDLVRCRIREQLNIFGRWSQNAWMLLENSVSKSNYRRRKIDHMTRATRRKQCYREPLFAIKSENISFSVSQRVNTQNAHDCLKERQKVEESEIRKAVIWYYSVKSRHRYY